MGLNHFRLQFHKKERVEKPGGQEWKVQVILIGILNKTALRGLGCGIFILDTFLEILACFCNKYRRFS